MKRHDDYGGFDRQDLIDIIEDQQADITKASAALAAAEKRITYLQNDNADRYTQIRELTKERDGLREALERIAISPEINQNYDVYHIAHDALKGGSDGHS